MTKWTYKADRQADGTVLACVVIKEGAAGDERFRPLQHFVKHSPTGFEMGYSGSGPADLAYSILVDYFLNYRFTLQEAQDEAWIQHQAFKEAFVAKERDHLSITDDQIGDWWIAKEIGEADARRAGADAKPCVQHE